MVQHTQERSGWVALPPALCSRLFQARGAELPLALELRPVLRRAGVALPSDTPCYAAWAGVTCAAGCVGVPAAWARALGLGEGSSVAVRPLPGLPQAVSVTVEPASEDDWEVVQLNAEYLEEQLLNQVGGSGGGAAGCAGCAGVGGAPRVPPQVCGRCLTASCLPWGCPLPRPGRRWGWPAPPSRCPAGSAAWA